MGIRGERGPQGDPGARGVQGDTGHRGLQGATGTVGHDEKRERLRDRKAFYRAASLLALPVAILALIPSLVGLYLVGREDSARESDRLVARYVFCRELESVKRAERISLTEQIEQSRDFLKSNPEGIPGISATIIRRGIKRNERLRNSIAPYPRGCAAFARAPSDLNVTVPQPKEQP